MDDGTNPFEIEDKPAKKAPAKRAEKQAARKSEPKKTTEKAPAKPRRSPRKAEPEEKLHAPEDAQKADIEESTEDAKPEEKTLRVVVEPEAPSFQVVGELPQSRQSKNFFVSAEKVNGLTVVSISQKGWVGPPQITFLAKQVDELRDLLYSFEKE